jgi:hypothetical protein
MQTIIAMDHAQQSLRLGSHEAELNRIDTAVVAAAKGVARLPSSSKILDALIDASVACADVVDNYEGRPIPTKVGTCLLRLYCAITDLEASLKAYAALSVRDR